MNSIIGIRPTPKIDSADNIFAIETKEKKYVLRAPDAHTKNTWLAKLCEYCGQGVCVCVRACQRESVCVFEREYFERVLNL